MEEAQSDAKRWHRAPAVQRKLGEINPETDIRVRLMGSVASISPVGIVVNDGSEMEIMAEPSLISQAKQGDFVRIFARVLPVESGYELRAELVQDMSNLDRDLHDRICKSRATT